MEDEAFMWFGIELSFLLKLLAYGIFIEKLMLYGNFFMVHFLNKNLFFFLSLPPTPENVSL